MKYNSSIDMNFDWGISRNSVHMKLCEELKATSDNLLERLFFVYVLVEEYQHEYFDV